MIGGKEMSVHKFGATDQNSPSRGHFIKTPVEWVFVL